MRAKIKKCKLARGVKAKRRKTREGCILSWKGKATEKHMEEM
jgi:hypothetical protein